MIIFLIFSITNELEDKLMKAKANEKEQFQMEGIYMTESEAKKIFEIKPEIQTRGIILGKKGNKVLSVPATTHVAIIGSARSGKTFGYGHSYIKQCALRGESIVINDLRGELYENFAKSLIDDGYDVKIFNVFNASNTLKSDNWNCFSDLLSAPKSIGENTDLIADVIINNTCPIEREDNFYHIAKTHVLSALCKYIMLDANRTESQKNLYEVYKIIADKNVEHISKLYLNISSNHPAYYMLYQFAQ